MSQTTTKNYEYTYEDSELPHHQKYIITPLLEMLSEIKSTQQKKLRVLDLGCGNGSISNVIAQNGYEVVGVEDSVSGYNIATKSFPQCQFIQSNILDLPYNQLAKSFDIVVSCEVIEHLPYPRELLIAAQKCLKPEGTLIVTTPYHGYLKHLIIALLGKTDQHFSPIWDGGHIKFFSVKTLQILLEQEKYTKIKFKFAGRFPYLWKAMLCSSQPMN